jgi:hypothetical protein
MVDSSPWDRRCRRCGGRGIVRLAWNDGRWLTSVLQPRGRGARIFRGGFFDGDGAVKGKGPMEQLPFDFSERSPGRIVHRRRTTTVSVRGKFYHLTAIRDALNRVYFRGEVNVEVMWGRQGNRKRRRCIRLGSYSFEDRLIRIHPALDQDFVPPSVVVSVVYHEMLHHVLGEQKIKERCRVHTAEFRKREKEYVHHGRAEAWEKKHIGKLLRTVKHPSQVTSLDR